MRASSEFQSAGVRILLNLRREGSGGRARGQRSRRCHRTARLDLPAGWRYVHLGEDLAIREDLVSTDPLRSGAFDILDRCDTRNEFHGGEIGLICDYQCRSWSLELLAEVASGNSHEVVSIRGSTSSAVGTSVVWGGQRAGTSNRIPPTATTSGKAPRLEAGLAPRSCRGEVVDREVSEDTIGIDDSIAVAAARNRRNAVHRPRASQLLHRVAKTWGVSTLRLVSGSFGFSPSSDSARHLPQPNRGRSKDEP